MASRRRAGRVARRKSRRAYRGAIRMSKRRLAKIYATKVGQTSYVVVRKGRRNRRRNMRSRRRRY